MAYDIHRKLSFDEIIFVTNSPGLWTDRLVAMNSANDRKAYTRSKPGYSADPSFMVVGGLPEYIKPMFHNTLQYRVCGTPAAVIAAMIGCVPGSIHIKFLSHQQFAESGVPERFAPYGGTPLAQMVIIDRPIRDDDLDFSDESRVYVLLDSQQETCPSQVDEQNVEHIVCHRTGLLSSTFFEIEEGDGDWLVGFKSAERLMKGLHWLRRGLDDYEESGPVAELIDDTKSTLWREFLSSTFDAHESDLLQAVRLSCNDVSRTKRNVIVQLLARLEPFIVDQLERDRQRLVFVDQLREQDKLRIQILRLAPEVLGIPGAFQADLRYHLAEARVSGSLMGMRAKLHETYEWLEANRIRIAAGGDEYFIELYDDYLTGVGLLALG